VLDQTRIPITGEAGGKLAENPRALLDFSKEQTTAVTGDRSAVKQRPDVTIC
jgi:hypothetical protein